ncbi:MAG: hypothetical protein HGA19_16865 [Oscillochloris sp.]|nr:hypothetical protein [Oscillochloris sp.]
MASRLQVTTPLPQVNPGVALRPVVQAIRPASPPSAPLVASEVAKDARLERRPGVAAPLAHAPEQSAPTTARGEPASSGSPPGAGYAAPLRDPSTPTVRLESRDPNSTPRLVVRPAGTEPPADTFVQRQPAPATWPVVSVTRVATPRESAPLVLPRRAEAPPTRPTLSGSFSAAPPMVARAEDAPTTSGVSSETASANPSSAAPTGAAPANADELAEQIMRKLMRQITIESERRGRRP